MAVFILSRQMRGRIGDATLRAKGLLSMIKLFFMLIFLHTTQSPLAHYSYVGIPFASNLIAEYYCNSNNLHTQVLFIESFNFQVMKTSHNHVSVQNESTLNHMHVKQGLMMSILST